jgi:hypothetical protein
MRFQHADWLHVSVLFLQDSNPLLLKWVCNSKSCFIKTYSRVVNLYVAYKYLRRIILKLTSSKSMRFEAGLSGSLAGCWSNGYELPGKFNFVDRVSEWQFLCKESAP